MAATPISGAPFTTKASSGPEPIAMSSALAVIACCTRGPPPKSFDSTSSPWFLKMPVSMPMSTGRHWKVPARRRAWRQCERPSVLLARQQQREHLASVLVLHQIERGRHVRQIGRFGEHDLHDDPHGAVAHPFWTGGAQAAQLGADDALHLAALHRQHAFAIAGVAGDDLELGSGEI